MESDLSVDDGSVPPTEKTGLLPESASPANSTGSETQQRLWEELDRPWPSTFERSIALLASPMIRAQDAALYTKSPKPGSTATALARRSNLDRGYYNTPERSSALVQGRNDTGSDRGDSFQQGLAKVQSLDFWKNQPDLGAVQTAQEKRMKQAQEYRKKILEEKGTKSSKPKCKKPVTSDGKATLAQCAFNLANILMGVGLLGLPFVFKIAGWFGGLFCLLSFGLITWRTSILIGRELNGDPRPSSYFVDSPFKSPLRPGTAPGARMLPPITSFPDIARSAFGETGCLILSVVLYFELFSCISIFFVSMGDHLHELFPGVSATTHMLLISIASLIPTIVLRTPALLSYLSMVGTFATTAVVLSVIASAIFEGDIADQVAEKEGRTDVEPYHIGWRTEGLTLAFGLVAYCFSGHAIIPSIYTSMERPQEFEKMVTYTFLFVVACCLAVAMSGYYIFGSTVQDQVTLSLERSSQAVVAMKALTGLMIMTAFSKVTLTIFPLALGLEETIAPYLTSERMVDAASSTIKLLLTILALGVAVFCPSFSILCSLVGLICTMAVSVIFPAAAHLKMFGPKLSISEKVMDWLFITLGLIMAVVGTAASLY